MEKKANATKPKSEFVTAAEVPVKILCYGPYTPSGIAENPSDKPKELVLIISGNPGIAEFMDGFARIVHEKSGLPVWNIGHGGHSEIFGPDFDSLYGVAGQIRQKQAVIDEYLQGVKIRYIGHSFGCYVVLKLLSNEENSKHTKSAYLICPVVENISQTPKGQRIVTKCWTECNFLMFLSFSLNMLPTSLKRFVAISLAKLTGNYNPDMEEGLLIGLNYRLLKNLKILGLDELNVLKDRDDETIRKNLSKLRLYYMENDGYVPPEFMENMKKTFPELRTYLDDQGTAHAFMNKSAEYMANLVVEWIRED